MEHRGDAGRSGRMGTASWPDRPTRVLSINNAYTPFDLPVMPGRGVWYRGWHDHFGVLDVDSQMQRFGSVVPDAASSANGITYAVFGGKVTALDSMTGATVWSNRIALLDSLGPPSIAPPTIILSAGRRLVAIGLEDGSDRWEAEVASDAPMDSVKAVAVEDDHVVAVTAGAVFSSKERYSSKVACFDMATGRRTWALANEPVTSFLPHVALVEGVVYTADSGGTLYAIDVESGEPAWERSIDGHDVHGLAIGSDVVCAVVKRTLLALTAKTGSHLWSQPVGRRATAPCLCGDSVLLVSGGELSAFDSRSGAPIWSLSLETSADTFLAVTDECIVCTGGGIEAFLRTGVTRAAKSSNSKLRPV